jgi:hypothetical protein
MKAWELLSDCSRWTRGIYARNKNGTPCSINSPSACQWCAMGAILKCHGTGGGEAVLKAQATAERLYGENIVSINDKWENGAYDAVLAILKAADI